MNCKLEVVRFRSEDVIATSGLLNVCRDYGTHYVYDYEEYFDQYVDIPALGGNTLVKTYMLLGGIKYDYSADGGLVKGDSFRILIDNMTPGARLDIKMGAMYHYVDGGSWPYALCEPQTH